MIRTIVPTPSRIGRRRLAINAPFVRGL